MIKKDKNVLLLSEIPIAKSTLVLVNEISQMRDNYIKLREFITKTRNQNISLMIFSANTLNDMKAAANFLYSMKSAYIIIQGISEKNLGCTREEFSNEIEKLRNSLQAENEYIAETLIIQSIYRYSLMPLETNLSC